MQTPNRNCFSDSDSADGPFPCANPQTTFLFFEATGPARGLFLRAGPVGSVWGLAPGRQGVQGASKRGPITLALSRGEREPVEGPVQG